MTSTSFSSPFIHPRFHVAVALILAGSAAALLTSLAPCARGQAAVVNATYTNPATGSWILGTNWDTDPAWPDGIGASASITSIQTANRTISLNDVITLGSLIITNNTTFTNTINNGTGSPTLEFDATAGPATLASVGTGASSNSVSATILLTDSIILNIANTVGNPISGALTLSGAMSGPGGVTKSGQGLVTISTVTKTYTGPTLLDTDTGRTRISASGSILNSPVTVKQGAQIALTLSSGNPNYTLGTVLNLNGTGLGPTSPTGNFPGAIRNDTNLAAIILSPVVLQSDTLIHVQGSASGSTTFSNTVSGPGKLTLTAPNSDSNLGQLVLGNTNTYLGGTLVNGGTLVASTPASTFGLGNITVDNALSTLSNAKLLISAGVLNAIADTATLSLAGGRAAGVADTGFIELGDGVNEAVSALFLGGIPQAFGTYGSTASAAAIRNDEYFSGKGIVTVVPEPAAVALLFGGLLPMLALRRPRRAA